MLHSVKGTLRKDTSCYPLIGTNATEASVGVFMYALLASFLEDMRNDITDVDENLGSSVGSLSSISQMTAEELIAYFDAMFDSGSSDIYHPSDYNRHINNICISSGSEGGIIALWLTNLKYHQVYKIAPYSTIVIDHDIILHGGDIMSLQMYTNANDISYLISYVSSNGAPDTSTTLASSASSDYSFYGYDVGEGGDVSSDVQGGSVTDITTEIPERDFGGPRPDPVVTIIVPHDPPSDITLPPGEDPPVPPPDPPPEPDPEPEPSPGPNPPPVVPIPPAPRPDPDPPPPPPLPDPVVVPDPPVTPDPPPGSNSGSEAPPSGSNSGSNSGSEEPPPGSNSGSEDPPLPPTPPLPPDPPPPQEPSDSGSGNGSDSSNNPSRTNRDWKIPPHNKSCEPFVMDSFVTNAEEDQRRTWNIKTMGIKGPGQYRPYRLIEVSFGRVYASGVTNMAGSMTELPAVFESEEDYDGFMQLQIGCYDKNGEIIWPDPGELPEVGGDEEVDGEVPVTT